MALFGFAPAAIKPTALVLNVLVSAVVSLRFYQAGFFSWRLFLPFAVASVPTALLGGYITLPPHLPTAYHPDCRSSPSQRFLAEQSALSWGASISQLRLFTAFLELFF